MNEQSNFVIRTQITYFETYILEFTQNAMIITNVIKTNFMIMMVPSIEAQYFKWKMQKNWEQPFIFVGIEIVRCPA